MRCLTQNYTAIVTKRQEITGSVVQADAITAERDPAGVGLRRLASGSAGQGFVRHLADLPAGARLEREASSGDELWFVVSGTGTLTPGEGSEVTLEADRGLWVPQGSSVVVSADAGGELVLDIVTLPASIGQRGEAEMLVRDWRDCPVEVTGDRQFRVLFGPGFGCSVATQFVGEIPPGRAPEHSHPYDESVMVLAGEGIVHIDGGTHPLTAGTCTHLPPGLPHCLENSGSAMLRVLGVFHPADSPAAKLHSSST